MSQSLLAKGGQASIMATTNAKLLSSETTRLLTQDEEEFDENDVEEQEVECLPSPTASNHLILTLVLPFLIYCLAVGAVAAPKINIVVALMCRKYGHGFESGGRFSWDLCSDADAHAAVGRFMVFANLLSGTLCVYSGPKLGSWSDRYGRRPFIAISAIGMLSGDIVSVVAAWFPDQIPVYWILLEFVIGGLTGAFMTTMSLIQSYAADKTLPAERTRIFSMLHACIYFGSAVGPAAGALLVRIFGAGSVLTTFYVAAACHFTFIGFVIFFLPESRPSKCHQKPIIKTLDVDDDAHQGKQKSSIRSTLHGMNALRPLRIFRQPESSRNILSLLAITDAFASGIQMGMPAIYILYSEIRLHWSHIETNLFLSITNTARTLVLLVVLPLAFRLMRCCQNWRYKSGLGNDEDDDHVNEEGSTHDTILINDDEPVPIVSDSKQIQQQKLNNIRRDNTSVARKVMLTVAIGDLIASLARTSITFTSAGIITSAGVVIPPLLQSSMTTYIEPGRMGELFGAISLVHALGRAVIPAGMQFIYSITVQNRMESIFWVLSGIFAFGFVGWSVRRL